MDLRPRLRQSFEGFTKAEVAKMEHLLSESKEKCFDDKFCKKLAGHFNHSSGRAGKPVVKWAEIKHWFQNNQQSRPSKVTSPDESTMPPSVSEILSQYKATENSIFPAGTIEDLSRLEFEAKSPRDEAWYDVDQFLSHRFLTSGEIEVRVRYVGFGEEEDEWVNIRDSLRVRSVTLEHTECRKLKIGDLVVCFQERQDQSKYYDAHVIDIQRRCHDIRGCRCLFSVRYDHNNMEEKVRLRRLCCRPDILSRSE